MIGGAVLGLLCLLTPDALTFAEEQIDPMLAASLGVGSLALIASMKLLASGVTKTPLGSTIVVSEMAGLLILPTTLLATVVSLLLTSGIGVITSQRERGGSLPDEPTIETPGHTRVGMRPMYGRDGAFSEFRTRAGEATGWTDPSQACLPGATSPVS